MLSMKYFSFSRQSSTSSARMLFFLLILINFFLNSFSNVIPSNSTESLPHIEQFLIFSPNDETVITFDPKQGWLLNEEKKFRLFVSGTNLQNATLVFSSSSDNCDKDNHISPEYTLSSVEINAIDVKLETFKRSHTITYVCLMPKLNSTLLSNQTNHTSFEDILPIVGKHFKLIREKDRLPFAAKICLILMLFVVSGFYSGLNLGLMSLSVNDLRLIAESEDSSMRYYAKRVLPLRRRGNYLLCSIVIANVLVNSLATVLLDSLVHGLFAVIGSTVMIVLMGEIIPQAICSRYGLVVGAHTHVITWISMFITGIISYPLGFILDKILGQEVTASYTRDQIAGLLTRISADIEKPELDVITGVLSLRKKTVKEAMTWLPDVFMLDKDRKTDAELLLEVHKHGFSRIPVYSHEKSNVIGIVKLRDFALITPEQHHLTVKHLMEFHTHPFGYTKTTDSLYNLMQEFLKSHWHIALVQELRNEEDNVDPVFATVGVITLEDVIEEMLQREIIEEADFFTDNRRKIQRKRAKTMDYTALVKRPVKGPSVSPQLKVAVFQFLSTNISQFTSGFISQEILKVLLNYNIYAMIKHQANQTSSSIYLYKKGFRYELFTLVMQGNAMLESGTENIISTVGPFSSFASSALLAENKTVKDVHIFLDRLFTTNSKHTNIIHLLDEISSIFIPDYNLIVNSELHVLQIHRLVWLAAVRATQRQRGNDSYYRKMPPEQLLSHSLDEISSVTNVQIDKTNLTSFQRIFLNEKGLTRPTNGSIGHQNTQTSSSVFEVIHSISPTDTLLPCAKSISQPLSHPNGNDATDPHTPSPTTTTTTTAAVVLYNPLLLSIPSYTQMTGNGPCNGISHHSSTSTNLTENAFNSSMHINRMFDDEQEQESFLEEIRTDNPSKEILSASTPIPASSLSHARSDTNLINLSMPVRKQSSSLSLLSEVSKSFHDTDEIRLTSKKNKCSPS